MEEWRVQVYVKMDPQGRVTIPIGVRSLMGLRPDQLLELTAVSGLITLRPVGGWPGPGGGRG